MRATSNSRTIGFVQRTLTALASVAVLYLAPTNSAISGPGERVYRGIEVYKVSLRFAQPAYFDSLVMMRRSLHLAQVSPMSL
jgi:hypothetical protein